ncbi:MAG TPA: sulfotransferase [Prolixibacteraceae bacterium]|nr:sulfotransferase [Prolixibacteraceae bacterium]
MNRFKKAIYFFLKRLFLSRNGIDILSQSLGNRIILYPQHNKKLYDFVNPYFTLSQSSYTSKIYVGCPIFITGRFRSGSTLLWNVFRQLQGVTSYYEPLNERKWFDPNSRGEKLDSTHVNVESDYWREYDGLNDWLKHLYQESWIERDLYMDEGASDWDLHRYIAELINAAPGRSALQFNRADFRLPWLKLIFPHANFIHIFRHPRDQWISTLMDPESFGPHSGDLAAFEKVDEFYLCMWVRDLQHWFPFLQDWSRHPYYHFYFLWKLSFVFGKRYCQHSLKFENLVTHPREVLEPLFTDLEIHEPDWRTILPIIATPKLGKWMDYAEERWFYDIEAECEEELQLFFGWGGNYA